MAGNQNFRQWLEALTFPDGLASIYLRERNISKIPSRNRVAAGRRKKFGRKIQPSPLLLFRRNAVEATA